MWTLGDLAPGEAEALVALRREPSVASCVALACGPPAVRGPAVGLDSEALDSPEEVDLVGAKLDVDRGLREATLSGEQEELLLEWVPCAGGAGLVALEAGRKARRAGAALVALESIREGSGTDEGEELGLVEGSLQGAAGDRLGEVDQGSLHGGHRDGAVPGGVGFGQLPRPMKPQPISRLPAAARDGQIRQINYRGSTGRICQSAAAERWLRTAPSPPATTAAAQRPSFVWGTAPTA